MKRSIKMALLLTGLAMPCLAIAEEISATIVAGHPNVFRWVKMIDAAFVPGVASALEGTGHSMRVDGQYGGAIAKVGEELETLEAGLAEIGLCQSVFDPAKLALQNVTYYTPFVSDNARQVADMMDQLHTTDPRMTDAYRQNGVVYLGAPVAIDDYFLMTTFPVDSLADLTGKKIAAPGAAINWLSGTGAVGVSGNLTTYHNEIKAGVYDGAILFASAALPTKLYEVAPNITRAGLGAQFAGALCANAAWYDGLPNDVQVALHSGADDAKEWYLSDLEIAVETALKVMDENGANITVASDEMRASWAASMDNVAKTWAAALDAKGIPGSEMLSVYMQAMRAGGATPLRHWDKE